MIFVLQLCAGFIAAGAIIGLFVSVIAYFAEVDFRVKVDQYTGWHKVYKGWDVESGKRFAIFNHPKMFSDCYEISERRKGRWVIVHEQSELPTKEAVQRALMKQSNWRRELDNMAYRDMDN